MRGTVVKPRKNDLFIIYVPFYFVFWVCAQKLLLPSTLQWSQMRKVVPTVGWIWAESDPVSASLGLWKPWWHHPLYFGFNMKNNSENKQTKRKEKAANCFTLTRFALLPQSCLLRAIYLWFVDSLTHTLKRKLRVLTHMGSERSESCMRIQSMLISILFVAPFSDGSSTKFKSMGWTEHIGLAQRREKVCVTN